MAEAGMGQDSRAGKGRRKGEIWGLSKVAVLDLVAFNADRIEGGAVGASELPAEIAVSAPNLLLDVAGVADLRQIPRRADVFAVVVYALSASLFLTFGADLREIRTLSLVNHQSPPDGAFMVIAVPPWFPRAQ
jgi:hypothetical protein